MSKDLKTNAMRLLEKGRVPYEALAYDLGEEPFSGGASARAWRFSPSPYRGNWT